jgi:hypothetical protein
MSGIFLLATFVGSLAGFWMWIVGLVRGREVVSGAVIGLVLSTVCLSLEEARLLPKAYTVEDALETLEIKEKDPKNPSSEGDPR